MLRTKQAKRLLTKKEQAHLTEVCINSMAKMRAQIGHQHRDNSDNPQMMCPECWHIGNKLGITNTDVRQTD